MTGENRIANARDARLRADDFLAAADVLAQAGMFDRALSQVYYALLHAAKAALLTEGLEPRTHEGARRLVGLHFVVPGKLAREHADALRALADEREQADYGAGYPNDETAYLALRARAIAAIGGLDAILAAAGAASTPSRAM